MASFRLSIRRQHKTNISSPIWFDSYLLRSSILKIRFHSGIRKSCKLPFVPSLVIYANERGHTYCVCADGRNLLLSPEIVSKNSHPRRGQCRVLRHECVPLPMDRRTHTHVLHGLFFISIYFKSRRDKKGKIRYTINRGLEAWLASRGQHFVQPSPSEETIN